eukprot:CAMPEP_0206495464 /NCGR_PEP_ID=MMETSP0324_2-20121206/48581_1 /ASSEMBLY_ACC=CAM_ASM_000836 /TAXON_ID=2866 /ORGANISM="Crypthecodinium cohnii, Strain Seligo" /LENGTH=64 /DNA_ID=CAMNT_0053979799 /DNA_START=75 /DNA_END=269 /DNA_ORIENTATION=+
MELGWAGLHPVGWKMVEDPNFSVIDPIFSGLGLAGKWWGPKAARWRGEGGSTALSLPEATRESA